MMYMEPLQLTCPHCQHPIECSVAWIRKKGQKCPACGGGLQALREEIERPLIQFATELEDVERIIEVENEFGIVISDVEAQPLRTFGDAHEYLLRRLAADGRGGIDRDHIWTRLVEAVARVFRSRKVRLRKPTDPFIRSDLVSEPSKSS